jgi:hypothetical protein
MRHNHQTYCSRDRRVSNGLPLSKLGCEHRRASSCPGTIS